MTHVHSGQRGRTAKTAEHPDFCPECRRLYRRQQMRWDQSRTVESSRGRRIIQGLMVRGYSLPFIADEVGVSKTQVSDWLNGNRPISLSHDRRLYELARVFGDVPAPADRFPRAAKTRSLALNRGYRAVTVVS